MSESQTLSTSSASGASDANAAKSGSRVLKFICWTVGLLGGLVGVLAVIGMLLPSRYVVETSIVVDASPTDIHPHVNDLKQWPEWSAWSKKQDATKFAELEYSYEGETAGKGAISKWTDSNNGNGELEIVDTEKISGIEYVTKFEGFDNSMKGTIRYKADEDGKTKVTWTARGDLGNNPVNRWMFVFFKGMIEDDFKVGLSGLQTVAEADAVKRRKQESDALVNPPGAPPLPGFPSGGGRPGGGPPGGGSGRKRPPLEGESKTPAKTPVTKTPAPAKAS